MRMQTFYAEISGIALGFSVIVSLIFTAIAIATPKGAMRIFTNDSELVKSGTEYLRIVGVTVATAAHPIFPEHRKQDYQYNQPVHIGENCWIGAGSVVTKDIPANVVAVGNPCRVIREINDNDKNLIYHGRQMEIAKQ